MSKKFIFDLDGTLVDASERLYRLFQFLVPESNFSKDEYWTLKRDKVNHQMILKRRFSNYSFDDFNSRWLSLIEAPEYLALDCLYPDTVETLERLGSQNEIYLLTARQSKENLLAELERLRIKKYFSQILVTEAKCGKDDLLKTLSLSLEDVFVSDMGKDIAIGNAAGLWTVAVTRGFMSGERLQEYKPRQIADNLKVLQE